MIIKIKNFFNMKGSFNWAVEKMKQGCVVKRKNSVSVKYKLDDEDQGRIIWAFGDENWKNANIFVDDLIACDWIVLERP